MRFLIKNFSYIFLLFSLLIFTYTFFKSEIIYKSLNRGFYINYYVISLLLVFFSFISFKFNTKIKKYLIILISSCIFTFYLFEVYISFFSNGLTVKEKKIEIYKKKTGLKFDERGKFEIYNDFLKEGSNVTMHVSSQTYRKLLNQSLHPLSGISDTVTIYCNENGYYSIYKSDKYGFNNPNSEYDNDQKIKYLLVGDSFTHGACVNRDDDIGSVLRTLSRKKVLNLGYGGNGPLSKYATLREYATTNVQNILWMYYEGNDLNDLKNELDIPVLKNYLNDLSFTQNLKHRQKEINATAKSLIEEDIKKINKSLYNITEDSEKEYSVLSKLKKIIKLYYTRNSILKAQTLEVPTLNEFRSDNKTLLMDDFKKILLLSKNLSIKNNSNFYFVYLPYIGKKILLTENYHKSLDETYIEIKLLLDELNIPLIDVRDFILKSFDNPQKFLPFEIMGHYNVEGYKKVAEYIFESIE